MHPMSLTPFLPCYSVHQHTSGALKFTPSSHPMQPLNGTVHIRVSPQTTFCIHKLAKQTVLSLHVVLCFEGVPEISGLRPIVSKTICVQNKVNTTTKTIKTHTEPNLTRPGVINFDFVHIPSRTVWNLFIYTPYGLHGLWKYVVFVRTYVFMCVCVCRTNVQDANIFQATHSTPRTLLRNPATLVSSTK